MKNKSVITKNSILGDENLQEFVENYELRATTISLPEGYCFYDTDFHPALHYLEYVKMYNIGKAPNKEDMEAVWGVSSESLPVYGRLSDAFRKAESNDSIKYIRLQKDVVDPDDVEMLQDLILTSVNEALRKVDEAQASQLGKYNIPGLM